MLNPNLLRERAHRLRIPRASFALVAAYRYVHSFGIHRRLFSWTDREPDGKETAIKI